MTIGLKNKCENGIDNISKVKHLFLSFYKNAYKGITLSHYMVYLLLGDVMLKDYINNKPTIESDRLILRPLVKTDIDDLKEWTPNKEIYTYWGKNPGKNDLHPELVFEKKEKPTKSFHLGIELKQERKIIGDIYIYLIEKDKRAKIAFRLNPKYHNIGIGTEASKAMINWCFSNTELQVIWTDVDMRNIPSIKLLEKCNFKKVKEVIQGKAVSVICDYYVYELHK